MSDLSYLEMYEEIMERGNVSADDLAWFRILLVRVDAGIIPNVKATDRARDLYREATETVPCGGLDKRFKCLWWTEQSAPPGESVGCRYADESEKQPECKGYTKDRRWS